MKHVLLLLSVLSQFCMARTYSLPPEVIASESYLAKGIELKADNLGEKVWVSLSFSHQKLCAPDFVAVSIYDSKKHFIADAPVLFDKENGSYGFNISPGYLKSSEYKIYCAKGSASYIIKNSTLSR